MLIDFTVENFRSIKEAQTLSMLATKHKEHPENVFETGGAKNFTLLKTAAIYGANASGKSNIIRAIQVFKDFIVKSTDLKLGEKIKYYDPHRLDEEWVNKPTRFEMEFITSENIRYCYSVSFTSEAVEREELIFFPKKQKALLFVREKGKVKFGYSLTGKKQNIADELLPNNLFLSKAANSNHSQLKKIYLYVRALLDIINIDTYDMFKFVTPMLLSKMNDISFKNALENLLISADTGIVSFEIRKRKNELINYPDNIQENIERDIREFLSNKIVTKHSLFNGQKYTGTIDFNLEDESEGTIKLFELLGIVLMVVRIDKIVIIDELERSLHPMISEFIVRLFNDPERNPKNAQLIFATHDTTLLNPDLLRRDQIWFTEKDEYGATQLYSLAEFDSDEVRKNTPFASWYLTGRFGAIPMIDRNGFSFMDKNKAEEDNAQAKKD